MEKTMPRLRGAFALACVFAGYPKLMVGARRGAPLAVGYGQGEMYLASDALAMAGLATDQIAYPEDGDWVELSPTGAIIHDEQGRRVNRPYHHGAALGHVGRQGHSLPTTCSRNDPPEARTCPPSAASRPDAAAPCCCAASAEWRSRPLSSACGPACRSPGSSRSSPGWPPSAWSGSSATPREAEAQQRRRRAHEGSGRGSVGGGGQADPASAGYPVLGTTTTTRSPGSPFADDGAAPPGLAAEAGPLRERLREPTILGAAGGVAQLAERYVRNVEAVGSNPITSTKVQVNGLNVGSPRPKWIR